MEFSKFGKKFTAEAGILSLMDDLGKALSGDSSMIMMGGGNPAHIPEVQEIFRERLSNLIQSKEEFKKLIGIYTPPEGEHEFLNNLASFFSKRILYEY